MKLNSKDYLVVITARKGSKRIPQKNVRIIAGQPLVCWTFSACDKLPIDHDVFVSTDCEQVQALAWRYGFLCPELRPSIYSSDEASSASVLKYVLDYCIEKRSTKYKNIILLQPTSPLRLQSDIMSAIDLFQGTSANAVQSYSPSECPPMWINTLPPDLSADDFIRPEKKNIRSQDLGTFYRINGAVYVIRTEAFLKHNSFLIPNSKAYVMPRERSIDIDDLFDFEVAELLLLNREKNR